MLITGGQILAVNSVTSGRHTEQCLHAHVSAMLLSISIFKLIFTPSVLTRFTEL